MSPSPASRLLLHGQPLPRRPSRPPLLDPPTCSHFCVWLNTPSPTSSALVDRMSPTKPWPGTVVVTPSSDSAPTLASALLLAPPAAAARPRAPPPAAAAGSQAGACDASRAVRLSMAAVLSRKRGLGLLGGWLGAGLGARGGLQRELSRPSEHW